ncbi:hypothetical protein GCM10023232_13150 [Sphingosinicella ginsenosidimutans]|uniref:Uncharacterized protein n=1 Tax=Allosphingosinicella ginsenosidimutans TaxID=1176539 RepID=A0A5C6TQF0_9SPHN|nr:hypothetical protein [Sphingosinicella ginsenosidimutans]TXC62410.1 hypothetical protein FRZ32_01315 [Sphingosinicella ginsenosidimutans]
MSNSGRGRIYEAKAEIESLEEDLEALEGEKVIALHPKIVEGIMALDETLAKNDMPEMRDDTIARVRALIHSLGVTPATGGRGLEIEITGRLAKMIELATGKPLSGPGRLTLERVKGIEPSS